MKKRMLKVISIFLLIVIFFSHSNIVFASGSSLVTVQAYSDADEQYRAVTLLNLGNTAYITGKDALLLSGYNDYKEKSGQIIFEYGNHKVEFKNKQEKHNGVFYYPLCELMDNLSTRYYYEESTNTLIFLTCSSYYENLLSDCKDIFAGYYKLDFYEGTGWQLAGVYEILGGLRVDVLWGGYQQELYEEAVANIIAEDNESSLSIIKQGDSIMSKLSKMLNFVEKDINGVKTYAEFLGTDLDGIIKAYSLLNKLIPGVSVSNTIAILNYVENSIACSELYSNSVKYGLVQNKHINDDNLKAATKLVYAYYDKNKPTYEAVLMSLSNDIRTGILDKIPVEKLTIELIKQEFGKNIGGVYINSAYIKLVKLILDELGMKEKTTAVLQTVACRNIQEAAIQQYKNGQFLNSKGERAKTIKYTTILYLRACQYAYSLYEFDKDLGFATNYWKEKTEESISVISEYSDDELSSVVRNDKLDLSNVKPSENQVPTTTTKAPATTTKVPTTTTKAPTTTTKVPTTTTKPVHTHSFSAATCTTPKKCSCGATEGKALGHHWVNATCKAPKKCSVCGVTTGGVAEHNYKNGTCVNCSEVDPNTQIIPQPLSGTYIARTTASRYTRNKDDLSEFKITFDSYENSVIYTGYVLAEPYYNKYCKSQFSSFEEFLRNSPRKILFNSQYYIPNIGDGDSLFVHQIKTDSIIVHCQLLSDENIEMKYKYTPNNNTRWLTVSNTELNGLVFISSNE